MRLIKPSKLLSRSLVRQPVQVSAVQYRTPAKNMLVQMTHTHELEARVLAYLENKTEIADSVRTESRS